jgi:hypothetical protein
MAPYTGGSSAQRAQRLPGELELELARTRQLYLVVDVTAATLSLKARGMVLDQVRLLATAIAAAQPAMGRQSWPELELPMLWRVSEPPAVEWRRLVAPAELRRYSESPAEAAPAATTPAPARAVSVPELPAHYTMSVDSGWQVMVSDRAGTAFRQHMLEAAGSSLQRLTGQDQPVRPPRLVLVMAPDDARRLLHVFQSGLPILIASGTAGQRPTGGSS